MTETAPGVSIKLSLVCFVCIYKTFITSLLVCFVRLFCHIIRESMFKVTITRGFGHTGGSSGQLVPNTSLKVRNGWIAGKRITSTYYPTKIHKYF